MNWLLMPTKLIGEGLEMLFRGIISVYDTIEDYLLPPFMMLGRIAGSVGDLIKDAFKGLSSFVKDTLLPPLNSVANFFKSVLKPVLDPVASAFTAVKDAVGDFFRSINTVGDVIDMMKLSFRNLALNLKEMWYAIKDFIPGLKDATPEERAALEAEKKELLDDKKKLNDRLSKQAEENLKKQKEIERQRAEERAARDKKFYDDKEAREQAASGGGGGGGGVDLSSPQAMLVSAGRMYEGQIAKNAEAVTAEIAKTKEMSGARQAEADALVSLANAKNEEEKKAAEATLKAAREKIDLVKKELDMAREKAAIERKAFDEAMKKGPAGTPTPMNRAGAPTPPQAGRIGGGGGGGSSGGGGGGGGGAGGGFGRGGGAAGGAAGGTGLKMPGVSDKQPGGVSDSELMPSAGDAAKYLKTPTGANLDGLDDSTKQRLAAMAAEYFNATGKKIQVNTAYRSTEEQAELFRKYGSPRAARPGRSKHEVGLAFDINSSDAAAAISMGLFDKYGFHRPIAAETWHIEPVEARGGSPDNPVNPGQKVLVANAGKESVPESGKMEKFANGGITSGPSIAGEAGPEAIVPLPDGRSIPIAGGAQKELVDLLAALNSKMDQLVAINVTLADINDRQLSVQKDFGSSGLMV
jgi:hypothetical protein